MMKKNQKDNKKPNIKILVACHKADPNIRQDDIYMPIHVGKALHPELNLGFQGDNTGDNISYKNESYCELTALYWAWKNLKGVDYIGLCHYRRYFKINKIRKINSILHNKSNSNIIVAKKEFFPTSIFENYAISHNGMDLKQLYFIIKSKYPEYKDAFDKIIIKGNKISPYNMFIMPWNEFNKYCKFIFSLLEKLENNLDISNYDSYQKRIYGFLAERLLNIYVEKNKKKFNIKELPVRFISNEKIYKIRIPLWVNKIRYNVIFRLSSFSPRIIKNI